jgi:isoleucyl-tRNA synthetase
MFQPVGSRVNFPQLEEKILKWWREKRFFQRSVEQRRGRSLFVLYDGPPTTNGSPAIHHALTSVFKDVIPRYQAMKGHYAPRLAGWDTHGLPVELEIEKSLGFSGKAQIEEYGVAKFNALCRESVSRYLKEFEDLMERIGYWVDLDNAYVTLKNEYIESVWWAIKKMWDKGLIYQGYKVTPHCPRCGTSLSSHEVAQGYRDDAEDPSVYIKFKVIFTRHQDETSQKLYQLVSSRETYFLAWTTTPWTLPGNTALAVSPEAEYVMVEAVDEYIILADARREPAGLCDSKVVNKFEGKYLIGAEYEPLFDPREFNIPFQKMELTTESKGPELGIKWEKKGRLLYNVIAGDFVSMEEGTGIVHIAPAYGEVDYQAGEEHGLYFVHHVDLQGNITGTLPGHGKFVKDADKEIVADLKSRGLLYRSETVRHTYPFCWRCEAPLLYYAKQTWYIRTTALKDKLISGNDEINWYPEHIKYGRFGDWLQNNVDWAFSRERYWGTPLPVWACESGEPHFDCVGSLEELKAKKGFSGFKEPLDLHRPFIDEVTFACAQCGKKMQRVPEVIDCWFDSGSMPFAQWHYPVENDTLLEDGRLPADFICEAVDQTRGWFYSLHAISTLLFGRPCYRNVICLGHILDAEGEKMSKRKGNVVWPFPVINKHGADALRWYFFTSSPPGNVRRFSEELVAEVSRRFLSTLWNVYSFFVIYANIDHFLPASEASSPAPDAELDRWIVSELNQLIADVDTALKGYNPTEAGRKIEAFVDGLSNWYVRRSRRRFWKSENDADKLSAYNTLYRCLVTLAKLLAPFTPFVAEELYQNLVRSVFPEAPESVHLGDFPVADESKIDRDLTETNRLAMRVSSMGRAARAKAGIKVRQPLAVIYVGTGSDWERQALGSIKPLVLEELNVKEMVCGTVEDVAALEASGYVVVSEAASSLALSTRITAELEAEGVAREIVHRLQNMRRTAGFEIADHIATYYEGDAYFIQVISGFGDYIKQETLSLEVTEYIPDDVALKEAFRLSGRTLLLGIKRAGQV